MRISLVRHGKDEEGYRGGWSLRGLISEGVTQSRKLGIFLREKRSKYNINTIMSSDLPRAVETSREIERELNIDGVYDAAWRETNNGRLAGMANEEAEVKFPGLYFNTLHMDTSFPEGESPRQFYNRICSSFNELCQKVDKGEVEANILLVTHGGVINILYYYLNGQEWTNKSRFHSISHTSMHTVEKKDDGWKISSETW